MTAPPDDERLSPPLRWCDSVADVSLAVGCSGSTHHLQWCRGEVTMVDHPEPEAEEALVALGGAEPPCLALARLWRDAIADGGFLEEWVDDAHLGPTRLSWLATALERLRSEGFHEFLRSLPPARAERMGRFLQSFPRPWLDRAAGAVAEAVVDGDGVGCDQASTLLSAAIAQRVRRAFVAAIGAGEMSLGAAALVPLSVVVGGSTAAGPPDPTGPDPLDPPWITGRITGPGRGVTIAVAPSWLHRVWAAGAAIVDGSLVLDLSPAPIDDCDQRCEADPAGPIDEAEALLVAWSAGQPAVTVDRVSFDGRTWARHGTGPNGDDGGPER